MDVNGAKALQRRLGPNRSPEPRTAPAVVSELAPPLYHWFGVEPPRSGRPAAGHIEPSVLDPLRAGRLGLLRLRRR